MQRKLTTLSLGFAGVITSLTVCAGVRAEEDARPAVSFELVASWDLLANLSGGLDRGVDMPGTIDAVGEIFWDGGGTAASHRIKFFVQGTVGGDISADRVGDLQAVSSLEAPNSAKLFEAWYRYALPDGRASMLIGLHDLNTEFYVLERAGLLLHSSFGNGPEISQANASLFPTTALATVVRIEPSASLYVSAGVYDGIPGKPSDPYGTHVRFDDGDGVLGIAEFGITGEGDDTPAKAGFGLWHSTAAFDDVAGVERSDNSGLYLIAETPFPLPRTGGEFGAFLQFGLARASRNEIERYLGGGIHWSAPFGRRNGDALSLGVAHARLSDKYRRATGIRSRAETAIELTYAWQLNRWLVLQPDVQLVIDPGTAPGIDDAFVAGCRVVLTLP